MVSMTYSRQELIVAADLIFKWKNSSLANYIWQAEPYIDQGCEPLLQIVKEVADEDRRLAANMGQCLEMLGAAPRATPQDPMVAELNYLSIRYLAELLLGELQRQSSLISSAVGQADSQEPLVKAIQEAEQVTLKQIARLEAALRK
jgi:hypothetical protein